MADLVPHHLVLLRQAELSQLLVTIHMLKVVVIQRLCEDGVVDLKGVVEHVSVSLEVNGQFALLGRESDLLLEVFKELQELS